MPRNIGYIELGYELLENLLGLPANYTIKEVWQDFDDRYRRCFKVVIEGPKMPQKYEGEILTRVDLELCGARCEETPAKVRLACVDEDTNFM